MARASEYDKYYEQQYNDACFKLYCALYHQRYPTDDTNIHKDYLQFKSAIQKKEYSLSNIRDYGDALNTLDTRMEPFGIYSTTTYGYNIKELEQCEKNRSNDLYDCGVLTHEHSSLIGIIGDRNNLKRDSTHDQIINFIDKHSNQLLALTQQNTLGAIFCRDSRRCDNPSRSGVKLQEEATKIYGQMYEKMEELTANGVDSDIKVVLVAEQHNSAAIEMAKLMIVDIASKLGIKKVLVELSPEDYAICAKDCNKNIGNPIFLGARGKASLFVKTNKQSYFAHFLSFAKKRDVKVVPVDVNEERKDHAEEVLRASNLAKSDPDLQQQADIKVVQERNTQMASMIPKESCVLIVGAKHTSGIIDKLRDGHGGAAASDETMRCQIDVIDLIGLAPKVSTTTEGISTRHSIEELPRLVIKTDTGCFNDFTPQEIVSFTESASSIHKAYREARTTPIHSKSELHSNITDVVSPTATSHLGSNTQACIIL